MRCFLFWFTCSYFFSKLPLIWIKTDLRLQWLTPRQFFTSLDALLTFLRSPKDSGHKRDQELAVKRLLSGGGSAVNTLRWRVLTGWSRLSTWEMESGKHFRRIEQVAPPKDGCCTGAFTSAHFSLFVHELYFYSPNKQTYLTSSIQIWICIHSGHDKHIQ